jgi:hypothetical protein
MHPYVRLFAVFIPGNFVLGGRVYTKRGPVNFISVPINPKDPQL